MDDDERLEYFARMVREAPEVARVRFAYANELLRAERLEDAVGELRTYLSLSEDEGNAWGRLGEALAQLGRPEEAADAFLAGIDQAERHGHSGMAEDFRDAIERLQDVSLAGPARAGGDISGYEFSPAGAFRMWQRHATVGRKTLLTTLAPRFVEALAYLAIMGLGLGTYLTQVDDVDYIDFIAPGVAASSVMFGAVIETTYNSFVRIHVRRVFEAAVSTPLSVGDVVVGEYLWAATRATIYGTVFLVVMAVFGLIHSALAVLVPLVFVVGALTFAVLGMLYTAYVSSLEHYNIFFTGILTPMFLFGGVFFPFDDLPTWAQIVGWGLPLSHLVAATRDLTLGGADWLTGVHVGVLVAITAALFPLAPRRLRRVLLR